MLDIPESTLSTKHSLLQPARLSLPQVYGLPEIGCLPRHAGHAVICSGHAYGLNFPSCNNLAAAPARTRNQAYHGTSTQLRQLLLS